MAKIFNKIKMKNRKLESLFQNIKINYSMTL